MTQLPSEGELIKQRDFYNLATDTILEKGTFSNDAHYVYGPVQIVHGDPNNEATTEGRFKLSDYYSVEAAGYEAGAPDPGLFERALLNGRAILHFTLYDEQYREYPLSYTACTPSLVNPYSTIGRLFYPHDHGVHPETKEPLSQPAISDWHENAPAIVRTELAVDTLVLDIATDLQLQKLIEAMRSA